MNSIREAKMEDIRDKPGSKDGRYTLINGEAKMEDIC